MREAEPFALFVTLSPSAEPVLSEAEGLRTGSAKGLLPVWAPNSLEILRWRSE